MTKEQNYLRMALKVARTITPIAFMELHRHENLIRKRSKRQPLSEDAYAHELLKRWGTHV